MHNRCVCRFVILARLLPPGAHSLLLLRPLLRNHERGYTQAATPGSCVAPSCFDSFRRLPHAYVQWPGLSMTMPHTGIAQNRFHADAARANCKNPAQMYCKALSQHQSFCCGLVGYSRERLIQLRLKGMQRDAQVQIAHVMALHRVAESYCEPKCSLPNQTPPCGNQRKRRFVCRTNAGRTAHSGASSNKRLLAF